MSTSLGCSLRFARNFKSEDILFQKTQKQKWIDHILTFLLLNLFSSFTVQCSFLICLGLCPAVLSAVGLQDIGKEKVWVHWEFSKQSIYNVTWYTCSRLCKTPFRNSYHALHALPSLGKLNGLALVLTQFDADLTQKGLTQILWNRVLTSMKIS